MKGFDERNRLIRKTRPFQDSHPMQTMRTALVSHQVETLLGLRFWSIQETAKLLLADAHPQQGTKNQVASRIHHFIAGLQTADYSALPPLPKVEERPVISTEADLEDSSD